MISLNNLPTYVKHSEVYRTLVGNKVNFINTIERINIYRVNPNVKLTLLDFTELCKTIYFWKIDLDQIPIQFFIFWYGNLTYVHEYFEKYDNYLTENIEKCKIDPIVFAIVNNNYDFITYLIENSLKTQNDIFIEICKIGDLDFAKKILKTYKVNIHAYDEYAFRWSCEEGHKEITEWLLNISFDYSGYKIDSEIVKKYYEQ